MHNPHTHHSTVYTQHGATQRSSRPPTHQPLLRLEPGLLLGLMQAVAVVGGQVEGGRVGDLPGGHKRHQPVAI